MRRVSARPGGRHGAALPRRLRSAAPHDTPSRVASVFRSHAPPPQRPARVRGQRSAHRLRARARRRAPTCWRLTAPAASAPRRRQRHAAHGARHGTRPSRARSEATTAGGDQQVAPATSTCSRPPSGRGASQLPPRRRLRGQIASSAAARLRASRHRCRRCRVAVVGHVEWIQFGAHAARPHPARSSTRPVLEEGAAAARSRPSSSARGESIFTALAGDDLAGGRGAARGARRACLRSPAAGPPAPRLRPPRRDGERTITSSATDRPHGNDRSVGPPRRDRRRLRPAATSARSSGATAARSSRPRAPSTRCTRPHQPRRARALGQGPGEQQAEEELDPAPTSWSRRPARSGPWVGEDLTTGPGRPPTCPARRRLLRRRRLVHRRPDVRARRTCRSGRRPARLARRRAQLAEQRPTTASLPPRSCDAGGALDPTGARPRHALLPPDRARTPARSSAPATCGAEREELVRVGAREVRDRAQRPLPHRTGTGTTGRRTCGCRRTRRPAGRRGAQRRRDSTPAGAKMIAASSGSGPGASVAGPLGADQSASALARLVVGTREREHAGPRAPQPGG